MRCLSFLFIVAALTAKSTLSQTATPVAGSVSGHLYCADTNTPCRFANVTIQTAPPKTNPDLSPNALISASQSRSYAASTDIEGGFQISNVSPGDYYILGQMQGYISPLDLVLSETSPDSTASPQALDLALTRITVAPAQTAVSNLNLSRGASLRGTVRYDDGSPAINVAVNLLRRDAAGRLKLYRNSQASTMSLLFESHADDRGRFYEPALPPGTYSIEATLPQVLSLPTSITGLKSINVDIVSGNALHVFLGNKYRVADAATIELHWGEDRDDVDITIPTQSLHTVSGRLSARPDGHSITEGRVTLLDPADKSLLRETMVHEDGTFTFKYVTPGRYLIQTESITEHQPGKGSTTYEAFTTPILVDANLADLTCSLSPSKR